ncbi:MAG: hypothetical protein ACK4UV_04705 [Ignavibacterium sp.]
MCCIKKNGKGKITVLGFTFGYTSDEHLEVYEKILKSDGIKKAAAMNNEDLQITIRFGEKFKYIFILNYHNELKTFRYKDNSYLIKPFSYKVIKEKLS